MEYIYVDNIVHKIVYVIISLEGNWKWRRFLKSSEKFSVENFAEK